jgi:hypothetical protein
MQVKTEKLPEVVNFEDYPHSPEDAAHRVRMIARQLNEEIGKAQRYHKLECTLQLRGGNKAIEGILVTKVY